MHLTINPWLPGKREREEEERSPEMKPYCGSRLYVRLGTCRFVPCKMYHINPISGRDESASECHARVGFDEAAAQVKHMERLKALGLSRKRGGRGGLGRGRGRGRQ